MSPSFKLISLHFFSAILSLLAAVVLMMVSYQGLFWNHFSPVILAVTHLMVLGWIAFTIFGAMFQLTPVVLQTPLWSEKLGFVQYGFHLIGLVLLIYSFYIFAFNWITVIGGSLLLIAVVLFIINNSMTIYGAKENNITGVFMIAGNIYLFLTVVMGLMLAINQFYNYLPGNHLKLLTVHAHLGMAGWIGMIICGVSVKLIPMFNLSHGFSFKPTWVVFYVLNVGIVGFSLSRFFGFDSTGDYIFIPVIAVAFLIFFYQILMIIKHRLKKQMDLGIKISLFGYSTLVVATLVGVALLFVANYTIDDKSIDLAVIYGFILIFGFFSQLIMGQLYKIVPFLIWLHYYSKLVGKQKVPLTKDLINKDFSRAQYYLTNSSIFVVLAGFVFQIGEVLLAGLGLYLAGAILFAMSIAQTYVRKTEDDLK